MQTSISILGCGWLGTQLGKNLIEQDYQVKGSTTTPVRIFELAESGIQPFYLNIDRRQQGFGSEFFFDTDILVISIPPERKTDVEESFPWQISEVVYRIKKFAIKKVIFISSTSVYQNRNNEVREGEEGVPEKPSGRALLKAEKLLLNENDFKTTIIRFGGLVGTDRNPIRYFAGRRNIPGNVPVNLIHAVDCVQILTAIIKKNVWGEVLNACSPKHPVRKEFYSKAAETLGLPAPHFTDESEKYKIVNSDKLQSLLNYNFRYYSPMDFLAELSEGDLTL